MAINFTTSFFNSGSKKLYCCWNKIY